MDQRVTPYAGTSANRLTEIINLSNQPGRLVEGEDFVYSSPRVVEDNPECNTAIDLEALKPGWANVTATYTRLGLSVLGELPAEMLRPVVVPHFPIYTHDMLDRINAALGLNLTVEEISNDRYIAYQEKLPLRIKDETSSLAWLQSEYLFLAKESNDISGLIQVTVLDGLHPPRR